MSGRGLLLALILLLLACGTTARYGVDKDQGGEDEPTLLVRNERFAPIKVHLRLGQVVRVNTFEDKCIRFDRAQSFDILLEEYQSGNERVSFRYDASRGTHRVLNLGQSSDLRADLQFQAGADPC